MTEKKEYFDVNAEPANFNGAFQPDPCEQKVPAIDGHEDEISTVRDSVLNEPAFTGQLKQAHLGQWLAQKRAECTLAGNWAVTLVAAFVGGLFAIVGALMTTDAQSWVTFLLIVLFAPIVEELLKQSGMIYLLEKKPYRICTAAQFIVAAVISALIFAAIENLMYIHLTANMVGIEDIVKFSSFRWKYCTLLHVSCSVIASLGLLRVWKKQLAEGRAADLAYGFWPFVTAMVIHGGYNLTVTLLDLKF